KVHGAGGKGRPQHFGPHTDKPPFIQRRLPNYPTGGKTESSPIGSTLLRFMPLPHSFRQP
ncbi:hypothetical protein, partial [Bacteroides thetaiotaomicron]|uniref:hypothetical protein n=1 Tax=Bacteroides thetaiotaomicron TaxID=818 RepID=UPI0020C831D2